MVCVGVWLCRDLPLTSLSPLLPPSPLLLSSPSPLFFHHPTLWSLSFLPSSSLFLIPPLPPPWPSVSPPLLPLPLPQFIEQLVFLQPHAGHFIPHRLHCLEVYPGIVLVLISEVSAALPDSRLNTPFIFLSPSLSPSVQNGKLGRHHLPDPPPS